jgi:hypothetical protein
MVGHPELGREHMKHFTYAIQRGQRPCIYFFKSALFLQESIGMTKSVLREAMMEGDPSCDISNNLK